MTTDIDRVPTLQDIYDSKDAMDDIQSFTYDAVDSFVDANGITRDTVTGRIKKMGFAVPVVYAGGIVFAANDNVKTVEEGGVIYAPLPSALPFTTSGTFVGDDDARFFVVQNTNLKNAIDLADYVTNPLSASAGINTAAATARAAGKALVSYDESIVYVLTAGVPVDIQDLGHLDLAGDWDTSALDDTEVAVFVGNRALVSGGNWRFPNFISSNPASARDATIYPQLRIQGSKGIRMEFQNIHYRQWYMDYTGGPGNYTRWSNAYNQVFDCTYVALDEVDSVTVTSPVLWFNENTFWGGRHYKIIARDNGYVHNHNVWKRPLFENEQAEIRLEIGQSNHFDECRFESLASAETITGISTANPAVVTVASHNYIDGDDVYIYNVGGMVELAEGYYTIANSTATTFELVGEDSTVYTPFTSGGFVKKPTVYFGENTYSNQITKTWLSGFDPRELTQDPLFITGVRDLGIGNEWSYDMNDKRKRTEVFNFSGDQVILATGVVAGTDSAASPNTRLLAHHRDQNSATNTRGFYPSVYNSYFPESFSPIAETAMIPVSPGDVFSFWVKAITGGVRFHIFCYDENGAPLSVPAASQSSTLGVVDSDTWFSSSNITTYTADGHWSTTADITGRGNNANMDTTAAASCSIVNTAIKYIRIRCTVGNNTDTLLKSVTAYYHEPRQGNPNTVSRLEKEFGELFLTGEPTMGIAPWGTIVGTPKGDWECTFTMFTTLNGNVANGAVSATVNEVAGDTPFGGSVQNGQIYGILLTDGTMAWGEVSGLAANTFTIDALASPAGTVGASAVDGAFVYFAKWKRFISHGEGSHSLGVTSGSDPFPNITTGIQNVAFAINALGLIEDGDSNSAYGGNSLAANISGDNNSGFGNQSLYLVIGSGNTASGKNSGSDIVGGSNNTLSGYGSKAGSATAVNRIVIGEGAVGTADNRIVMGKASAHVYCDYTVSNAWTFSSDGRLKTDVTPTEIGLDFILSLKPKWYRWKRIEGVDKNYDIVMHGLVTQDVECADYSEDVDFNIISKGGEYDGIKYGELVIPLINAIKTLEARIRELEAK